MRNISIEQYLASPAVSLADVAAMLLQDERTRLPLPGDVVSVRDALAPLEPFSAVREEECMTVRAPAA